MGSATAILKRSTGWKIFSAITCALGLLILPGFFATTHGPRTLKRIALTLDDGPHPTYTDLFLRYIAQEKIPATFFISGNGALTYPALLRKLAISGHEIGNHSLTHKPLAWSAPWEIAREIQATDQLIRASGYTGPIAFRAPFGQRFGILSWVLAFQARSNTLYDVKPSAPDYFRSDPQAMADAMYANVRAGSILLLHDGGGERVEALEALARLVPRLKQEGFEFVTLSALLNSKKESLP